MDRLIELAERLEQVSGADRELDREIWIAVCTSAHEMNARGVVISGVLVAPAFTASLDAAMARINAAREQALANA